MNESSSVRGVILAHGALARGLADAVARIAGLEEGSLTAISNNGKSPEALSVEVSGQLGNGPVIVFTDLPSGSCALTAQLCCREDADSAVVFGVNLSMLLDFVFHRDLPLQELIPRLLEKGRGSIRSVPDYSGSQPR